MSFVNILPSFNPENRKLYGWARERVDVARKQADTAPTPEDSAAIRRYADRLQTGMRIKKAGDACETTGLILLQIAGCTFPAGLFSATACIAVGGAFVGGMLLYLGAILSGSSNQPTRHVLAGPTGAKDALTFSRYQQEMLAIERLQAESAKQTAQKVAQFGQVLEKVADQPPGVPEAITRDGDNLKIGNLTIPVRQPTLQDALPPPRARV